MSSLTATTETNQRARQASSPPPPPPPTDKYPITFSNMLVVGLVCKDMLLQYQSVSPIKGMGTQSSQQSPSEIKRRELDSQEEVRHFCGSRRDQEEGGGARPSSQPRRDHEQGGGAGPGKLDHFCFKLLLNSGATDIVLVTAQHSS